MIRLTPMYLVVGYATLMTWQPALFIACDYGHATATTVKRCHGCGWWIATGVETVSPRAFA